MNSYLKPFTCIIIIVLFGSFFNMSCASSNTNEFHTKIQAMTDENLLSYYYGINERMKDIGNDIERGKRSDQNEQERFISNMPFFMGGEGYSLNQKRKIILKELNTRGINP